MERLGVDKKQENTTQEQKDSKRTILPAEKKFNWKVYGLLNYWIQVSTAVAAASYIQFGGGKKHFEKAAKWTGENIISKITPHSGERAAKDAHTYLTGTTLLMIGNFFLVPVKMLENRKAQIVREIDDKMIKEQEAQGYPISDEQRALHEKAHADLAKQPKTNWPTLIAARVSGFGAFYLTRWLVGDKKQAWMEKQVADGVEAGLKHSGVTPLKKLAEQPHTRNVAKTAFIDFFYSVFVASAVFQTTKYLTARQKPKNEPVANAAPEKKTVEPATTNRQEEGSFADKHPRKEKEAAKIAPHEKYTDYVSAQTASEPQVSV